MSGFAVSATKTQDLYLVFVMKFSITSVTGKAFVDTAMWASESGDQQCP